MTTYSGSVDSNFIPVEINPDVKVAWYDSKDKLTKKYPKFITIKSIVIKRSIIICA